MSEKILIVTDGKAGHENQSRALCQALGRAFDLAPVRYPTRLHKALSYAADHAGLLLPGLYRLDRPAGDAYAAVVCTGSTAFYPGQVTARRRGLPVAAVLFPRGYRLEGFDCVLAPAFDRPPERPNVVRLPVNLTATDDAFYAAGVAAFRARHPAPPGAPAVAVIVGGPNACAALDADWMRRELDRVFAATAGRARWVTTSRRTPPAVEAVVDAYPFDYKLLYSRDRFNPIPAFVSLCETLFVTADSTGMLSEAVTRGRAGVEVLMNLTSPRTKFARFIAGLEAAGALHRFDGAVAGAARKLDLRPAVEAARRLLGL